MAHNLLDNEHVGNLKRDSFGEDVIPILESRMTYGPLKEMYSRITFPPSLANGDLLVGVGPIVRRMGWTDERILAVGMYIDPETAGKELEKFHGRVAKTLHGDQQFYDHILFHTTFRRSFVVTARKRVSKSVLTALLRDELAPRMGPNAAALQTFLGFIEKSLKKAESMVMRIHEDDRFEYRLRGQLYPPIASHALCKCIQALFFDSNSIQHDAKRGLIERLPSLWGGEVLDAQDEIFGSLHERIQGMDSEDEDEDDSESDDDEDDDDDDDDDDDEDDSEAEDLFGTAEQGHDDNNRQSHQSHQSHHESEDQEVKKTEEKPDDEMKAEDTAPVSKPRKTSRARKHSHTGPRRCTGSLRPRMSGLSMMSRNLRCCAVRVAVSWYTLVRWWTETAALCSTGTWSWTAARCLEHGRTSSRCRRMSSTSLTLPTNIDSRWACMWILVLSAKAF